MILFIDDRKMLGYGLLGVYFNIFYFVMICYGGYSEGVYVFFNCLFFLGDEFERVEKN